MSSQDEAILRAIRDLQREMRELCGFAPRGESDFIDKPNGALMCGEEHDTDIPATRIAYNPFGDPMFMCDECYQTHKAQLWPTAKEPK